MKKFDLFLTDTASKKKKKIIFDKDLSSRVITMYVCGITPYDHCHIGHARCYVAYDILVRLIRFLNFSITYVQNVTDVNDKIFKKSMEKYSDETRYKEISKFYFLEFQELLTKMGCIRPDFSPRVSDSINQIIQMILKIIKKGCAYQADDGVYFDVNAFPLYGSLSGEKKLMGDSKSRVQGVYQKKSDHDFALWKNDNSPAAFASPWGNGFPGWHIECSAMIANAFGRKAINIHGGGLDLLFPHHENEKAQTECISDHDLADIWMHVAFMQINNEKMSKSLGNSLYLKDILKEYDPMVLRFYFLMHHYTSPINFDFDALSAAKKSYESLTSLFQDDWGKTNFIQEEYCHSILDELQSSLFDDLNTPAFIGIIFKHKKEITEDKKLYMAVKVLINFILGLSLEFKKKDFKAEGYSSEVKELIRERGQARRERNFKKADEIRDQLKELGVSYNDEKI